MSEEMNNIIDVKPLDNNTREIAQKILDEKDIDRVKDLTTFA